MIKKLLLVDDQTLFRELFSERLQRLPEGIDVAAVASCEAAFALLERGARFDLVLMDLALSPSAMSGSEGIRKLRRDHPDLPVVALSGTRDSATMRQAIDDGAMGFIPKTHSEELLLWALELILVHKGIYVPPEILSGVSRTLTTPKGIGLTERQADVLYELLKGHPNKIIARELGIEESTVKIHVNAVLRALKVTNRTQAVIAAGSMNLAFGGEDDDRIGRYACPGCGAAVSGRKGLLLACRRCDRPMPESGR